MPIAARTAALSDAVRLHILWTLSNASPDAPLSTQGLTDALDRGTGLRLSQPTISHHVGVLTRAGLVTSVRYDRRTALTVNHKAVAELTAELETLAAHGKVYA